MTFRASFLRPLNARLALIFALGLGLAVPSFAQDTDAAVKAAEAEAKEKEKVDVSTDNVEKLRKNKERVNGWDYGFTLGATGSALQNNNFVGQTDGLTLQFGILFGAKAYMTQGNHEWRNDFVIEHAQLKTPAIDRFVKAADRLELRSLYLWRIPDLDWLGPFARFRGFTQIFPGELVRAESTTITQTDANGNVTTRSVPAQTPIPLTAPFEPLVLEESLGIFAEPIQSDPFTLEGRLGVGAQQVFAQNGFATADNPDTPELELVQLAPVVSAGAEAAAAAKGIIIKDMLTWNLGAGIYYQLLISDDRGLDAGELLHVNVDGGVSLKLTKWLSVDYRVLIVRQPFVLNDYQIQNSLLVTTGFDWGRSTKPKKEAKK